MERIKARDALLRQLIADGLTTIFGNPGSTEESFLQSAAETPKIEYVLGLQEASVAAMADGWARVAKKPAICQLHSAVGLGNGMGVLYEANRAHTPMVVFAGEPPVDLQSFDGFLAGDLAQLASPLTKWSARITHGSQLPRMLRRAIKTAGTPPYGPVFLALPMDVLDEEIDAGDVFPTSRVTPPAACSQDDADEIARRLASAKAPLLLVGDGIAEANARDELSALAHHLAIPVWGVEFNELSLSFRDPMFMGLIGHSFGDRTRAITTKADVILAVGTPVFPELFPSRKAYFAPGAVLMQIDLNPWEIGKNFPVHVGVQADPKGSLRRVLEALRRIVPAGRPDLEARRAEIVANRKAALEQEGQTLDAVSDTPAAMSPTTLMRTLVDELPTDAMVYDESITSTTALLHHLRPDVLGSYVLARGGCIGVGWPGAVGAAVFDRSRRVIAPSGDGSALFALQSLWTAARYRLKVVFVVCNNGAYRILKINLLNYIKETNGKPGPFPFMDIDAPRVDFATIAMGFGMETASVKNASELRAALRTASALDGPMLIDAMVNGTVDREIEQLFGSPHSK